MSRVFDCVTQDLQMFIVIQLCFKYTDTYYKMRNVAMLFIVNFFSHELKQNKNKTKIRDKIKSHKNKL